MEKNPKLNKPRNPCNSNTPILVIAGVALAVGTGIAVKTCLRQNNKDDKAKIEEPASAEKTAIKAAQFTTDAPRFSSVAAEPDASTTDTDDASQAPPDVQELTLNQACQELKNVTEEDDAIEIYPLLKNIMTLLDNDITMVSGHKSFRQIAKSCNFSEKQLLDILKIAINQGDTRVADLVNDLIKKKCKGKTNELRDKNFQNYIQGTKDCGQLSTKDIDERSACIQQVVERREQGRQEAKDFAENQCPYETATDWGLDQDKIEELAALKYANELATGRIVLINPNTAPSEDDIMAYMMALRPLVVHLNEPAILEALGVKDETEFETKYFDEVADSLKKREGELYQKSARVLGTLYGLKEVLGNF